MDTGFLGFFAEEKFQVTMNARLVGISIPDRAIRSTGRTTDLPNRLKANEQISANKSGLG